MGPRYIPGPGEVANADRITSPVAPSATRPAHDISLRMYLDAGLPITDIQSDQHAVDSQAVMNDPSQVTLQLADRKELPNRDFVLRWRTTAERIEDAILTHTDKRGKFFTLVLQPPARTNAEAGGPPANRTSGVDRDGRPRGPKRYVMSRRGNDLVRRYLWMAALSAIRHNGAVGALYARVVAKHPDHKSIAVGHAMRKLLHQVHALWKTGRPFDSTRCPAPPSAATQDFYPSVEPKL